MPLVLTFSKGIDSSHLKKFLFMFGFRYGLLMEVGGLIPTTGSETLDSLVLVYLSFSP